MTVIAADDPITATGSILVVDDNPNNLRVLSGILNDAGYRVRATRSGELALRSAANSPPDLILLDVRMPEMDGYEVCRQMRAKPETQDVPVIFISALQETEDKVNAFKAGGVDYIVKPFQMEEVLARVRTHMSLHEARRRLREAYAEVERRVEERTHELLEAKEQQFAAAQRLQESLVQTIEAIAIALEKRDPYTAGHQKRVSAIATEIGRKLGLPEDQVHGIRLGGLVHDIGKIHVPAEILSRPGRLSDPEMELIRTHPQVGYEIIQGIQLPWPVAQMVLQHQERYDGSGYPKGLKGEEILFEARILAVADVVEAMSSHRPYRPALGVEAALEEIETNLGLRYDPAVAGVALELFRDDGFEIDPL